MNLTKVEQEKLLKLADFLHTVKKTFQEGIYRDQIVQDHIDFLYESECLCRSISAQIEVDKQLEKGS